MMRGFRLATLCAPVLFACPALACPGVFIRNSQNYDNGGAEGGLVLVNGLVRKGARDEIVGYDIVDGVKFHVQLRAYPHDSADIKLKPCCALTKYEQASR